MNLAKEYKVSWWRQYSAPVRLSWWRRWLGQQRTSSVWIGHHCVVTLTDSQVQAFAVAETAEPDKVPVIRSGWDGLSTALIVPLIHAVAGNYTNLAMPVEPAITSMPAIVGLQVEEEWRENPYVRTNLLPHSGPSVAESIHADRGEGGGPV